MRRPDGDARPAPDLDALAAPLGYRETGDPFGPGQAGRPRLRVGLCSSLSWGFLRGLVRRVQAEPDGPSLSFLEGATGDIVRAARRGEVDVGFVYGAPDDARLEQEALWREPLLVILPDQHPLARGSDVRPEALRAATFLVAGDLAERDLQIALLEQVIGAAPSAVLMVPVERATLTDLVGLGFGLVLAPASAMGAFHPGVSVRPIAGPAPPVAFHAVWRSGGDNPALPGFLASARAHAAAWRG
jgi:DNA-binding transcriptional LysR family regulator